MPLRINSNNPASAHLGVTPATKTVEIPAPAAAQDGLQLSKSADTLSRITKSDKAARAQRISQLAAAGASGSYKVDSAEVSHAIVERALAAGGDEL